MMNIFSSVLHILFKKTFYSPTCLAPPSLPSLRRQTRNTAPALIAGACFIFKRQLAHLALKGEFISDISDRLRFGLFLAP